VLLQSVIKDWKTPKAKISNNLSKVASWLERHRAMIGKCIWGVDVSNNYQRMPLVYYPTCAVLSRSLVASGWVVPYFAHIGASISHPHLQIQNPPIFCICKRLGRWLTQQEILQAQPKSTKDKAKLAITVSYVYQQNCHTHHYCYVVERTSFACMKVSGNQKKGFQTKNYNTNDSVYEPCCSVLMSIQSTVDRESTSFFIDKLI